MVKKIMKYAKFMVCIILMVSLVAPSYAALSASDGSAFVTKAEFDSALADFNARLTTFEAGINSKIDSQVTSYLDRNGIWNGQDQVLDGGNMDNITWHGWSSILNMGIWGPSSVTDNDLDRSEYVNLYGCVSPANEGTLVPHLLKDVIDLKYKDAVCSSILGRLIYYKSQYAKSMHYVHQNDTPAHKSWGVSQYYLDADNNWSSVATGNMRTLEAGHEQVINTGLHMIGRPRKMIDSITKSGLMFLEIEMNHIANNNPYYGWQFMAYDSCPDYPTGFEHGGSFPHAIGAALSLNVFLDATVGEHLDDATTWNGTILTDQNFKDYSRASYSPVTPIVTILGGDPKEQITSLMGGGTGTNRALWYDVDKNPNVVGATTIKMGLARNRQTLQFFVKKGEQLWLTGNWSYSFGNNGGMNAFFGYNWIIGGSSPLTKSTCMPRWKMSASVY